MIPLYTMRCAIERELGLRSAEVYLSARRRRVLAIVAIVAAALLLSWLVLLWKIETRNYWFTSPSAMVIISSLLALLVIIPAMTYLSSKSNP